MNDTPMIRGTTEVTFNSTYRRSLVTELKAKSLCRQELHRRFPRGDNDVLGVLEADPSLKDFLDGLDAAAAFLRKWENFMTVFSEADCRAIIEDYVLGGGDGGLTEEIMREACGLPVLHWTDAPEATPRTELSEASPQLGPAQAPSTPKGPGATRREAERNMRQHHTELIRYCLDHRMDTLNEQSISRLPIWSPCGKPGQKGQLVPEITVYWALERAGETWAPCHTMCSETFPLVPPWLHHCQSTHRVFRFSP